MAATVRPAAVTRPDVTTREAARSLGAAGSDGGGSAGGARFEKVPGGVGLSLGRGVKPYLQERRRGRERKTKTHTRGTAVFPSLRGKCSGRISDRPGPGSAARRQAQAQAQARVWARSPGRDSPEEAAEAAACTPGAARPPRPTVAGSPLVGFITNRRSSSSKARARGLSNTVTRARLPDSSSSSSRVSAAEAAAPGTGADTPLPLTFTIRSSTHCLRGLRHTPPARTIANTRLRPGRPPRSAAAGAGPRRRWNSTTKPLCCRTPGLTWSQSLSLTFTSSTATCRPPALAKDGDISLSSKKKDSCINHPFLTCVCVCEYMSVCIYQR
ncbi:hypothetical protein chiPu_0016065 [Chiloscyllium punctatum]|uniref:Uncharacterized protein n=1 Tax=Chiloscyllium punctatum TaxID=137246 RepID=A0A401T4F6_CHIPU|nr:hypothetical protein [Chiloscyllium punctatum]